MNTKERGGKARKKNRLKHIRTRKSDPKIKLALPHGHLQEETKRIFLEAGINLEGYDKDARNFRPKLDDHTEIKIIRPQEIPHLVKEGTYDVGITGLDWLKETNAKIEKLLDLEFGHVKLVLAISRSTRGWKTIKNVNVLLERYWDKEHGLTIATEYMHLTQRFISKSEFYQAKVEEAKKEKIRIPPPKLVLPWLPKGKSKTPVQIVFSYGTTEGKPPDDADAIVDNTTTGRTLRENNLHIVDDNVMKESTAWLIANRDCLDKEKIRAYICNLAFMLHQVVMARKFVHLFANLPKYAPAELEASHLNGLAQQEVTVVQSNRGARIDLLVARDDYNDALASLHSDFRKKATDIIALKPQKIAWPSKHTGPAKAPYMKIFKDTDLSYPFFGKEPIL